MRFLQSLQLLIYTFVVVIGLQKSKTAAHQSQRLVALEIPAFADVSVNAGNGQSYGCTCDELDKCIKEANHLCWQRTFGGILPPQVFACEKDHFADFEAIDNLMGTCLAAKNASYICKVQRSIEKNYEVKRRKRDLELHDVQKRSFTNAAEGVKKNLKGKIPNSVLETINCWEKEEAKCFQPCQLSREEDEILHRCDVEEKIADKEHQLGTSVSDCIMSEVMKKGIECYLGQIAKTQDNGRKLYAPSSDV